MRRILAAMLALIPVLTAAQGSRENYIKRYNQLASRLGPSGMGIETLLDDWGRDFPDDTLMLGARFKYYFNKSSRDTVIVSAEKRHLGNAPIITLKDSLGRDVSYFEEKNYDDSLFALALNSIDRLIAMDPQALDWRLSRTAALTAYEKGSPDMALSSLRALVDYNYKESPSWKYPGLGKVDNEVFKAFMQDYCAAFWKLGTPSSQEAFKSLSDLMLSYNPSDAVFMDNLGSWYLVCAKNHKKALKIYGKVLKAHPDDLTAIRNCILISRRERNTKMEMKYLPMLEKYTQDENEKAQARMRLTALAGGA